MITEEKCFFFGYECTLQHHYILVICQVICAKVVGATSARVLQVSSFSAIFLIYLILIQGHQVTDSSSASKSVLSLVPHLST